MSVCFSMRSILRNHRFRRDARTLEDEEEMWFNTDEEDLEDGEAVVPPSDKMKSDEDLMDPISKFMERKKRMLPLHADGMMLITNYYDYISDCKMLINITFIAWCVLVDYTFFPVFSPSERFRREGGVDREGKPLRTAEPQF